MTYYVFIIDGKINGCGQTKCLNEAYLNIEVTKDVFYNLEKYIYDNGEIILNPNYEEEIKAKKEEEIAKLNMTRGDFFEGLIIAKGYDEYDVLPLIDTLPLTDIEKKVFKNRVENANDFFRGYPLIDLLAEKLDLTSEQMTNFFKTKDYKYLLSVEE